MVTMRKGVNWVDINCRADKGVKMLTFWMDTIGKFTVDCPSGEYRVSVNQMDLAEGRKGRFGVEVDDSVQWYASVQVPDHNATVPSP
ncbi:hypothetical protein ABZ473_26465 [Streptomyces cellulosae]